MIARSDVLVSSAPDVSSTCPVDRTSARLPAFVLSCPRVGYVSAKSTLTDRQLAAPIHVRVINASAYCLGHDQDPTRGFGPGPTTDLGPYDPSAASSHGHQPSGGPQVACVRARLEVPGK
jgi:hypothetical protein